MSDQQASDDAVTGEGAGEPTPEPTQTATAVLERPLAAPATDEVPGAEADNEPAAQEPIADPASGAVRTARVFLCECGYRTVAIWGDPQTCQAKRSRRGAICGKPLYALDHVPDKVQKALNPLKASKKKAKGSD